jgi:CRP-like cAMP-binding protein
LLKKQVALKTQVAKTKQTTVDASALLAALNHFHPLTPEMERFFINHVTPCSFKKDKLILKAGGMCNFIYFIKKGAVRGFIREGKKDITTWITVEGELVTSIYSLDVKTPATENMQAIEDCDLLALSYADLHNLYTLFPEFNVVTRKLLQHYYRDAEGRAYIARLTNAENKYRHFLLKSSHLANRIALTYIASYLGMTLETLSRVRKKISSAAK